MKIKTVFPFIVLSLYLTTFKNAAQQLKYQPTTESLSQHPVPDWYNDAKFGIFIHWGLYSVPGYAPIADVLNRPESLAFSLNPYAEWYYNTMMIDSSLTQAYHIKKYGKYFSYYNFIDVFNREIVNWNPKAWANLFKEAGAQYAVLTTKHHDGFTLWESKVANPNFPANQPTISRDIVGELTTAVRNNGLKMGLYYSGGLDWSFIKPPMIDREWEKYKPQTKEYAAYADEHCYELINKYKPSVFWNDIDYPKLGKIPEIFSYYYNTVPEGVINDRWGVSYIDFTTPEYETKSEITHKKWEACRGLGNSFGYNQLDDEKSMLSVDQLVDLLVDIVSKNGNLLLNIGPMGNGSIPEGQQQRLIGIGNWLKVNGESIYGTRPFTHAEAKAKDDTDIRFTLKGDVLYMILLQRPKSPVLELLDLTMAQHANISLLGSNEKISWTSINNTVSITLPEKYHESEAYVLKIKNE